ncbi:hypothetical protein FK220_006510 [Flavobacteriaceae bacterium TP-CH-4]|uniref:Uncharacterized protein n=1 Tax=Pelagihabitans pacificus TaxID=2696054 RepID=A0A967ED58_9FLAO|nr:hypothetical protein [Pelagihabitans pacificus]NHF58983.1 hypothetical protein [Pelagihabitans pacificus]
MAPFLILSIITVGFILQYFFIKQVSAEVVISKARLIKRIKNNSIPIKVDSNDCIIIKNDKTKFSGVYESGDVEGLKFIKYNKWNFRDKQQNQSILICNSGKKKYFKHINIESTILRSKLKNQDFIFIYEYLDTYYIDLEFLKPLR